MNARDFCYKLFFVVKDGHDDELDLGWLLLLFAFFNGLLLFDLAALFPHRVKVSVAAWSWYGSLTAMAFISGVAIARARLIAKSKLPGEIATGIAQAGGDIWTDDERGDYTDRAPD